MNPSRIIEVNTTQAKINNVLYIMYNAFRINDNHAFLYARELSLQTNSFSIYLCKLKEENSRNMDFFKEGIHNYKEMLSNYSQKVKLFYGDIQTDDLSGFDTIVMDMAYLNEEKEFLDTIKEYCVHRGIGLEMVETNTIVPVTVTSDKEEYSARTIRPKIWRQFNHFLDIDESFSERFHFEEKAQEVLKEFVEYKLRHYDLRNHPDKEYTSGLSAYLKYGFISPLTIYNYLQMYTEYLTDSFIEELIVRRDLSYNFIYYNEKYDQFKHMTHSWAYLTMDIHGLDEKEYLYTIEDYILFNTHDIYFNAAMKEMVHLGTMHGYMRMYWGKKIIEWSPSFQKAYEIMITLNNYYFLDGNTPNGYAGVAWCFGKHDRAWNERAIFGKIRYMNQNGLKRKFDIDQYVKLIDRKVEDKNENI
jgi:deoxyribodipyrimidine photo-lyase